MPETLLLKQPTISSDQIAFIYAGDLWVTDLKSSRPHRLTAQKGQKVSPSFSPDGHAIHADMEHVTTLLAADSPMNAIINSMVQTVRRKYDRSWDTH
jgi:tricorn protease-like protein